MKISSNQKNKDKFKISDFKVGELIKLKTKYYDSNNRFGKIIQIGLGTTESNDLYIEVYDKTATIEDVINSIKHDYNLDKYYKPNEIKKLSNIEQKTYNHFNDINKYNL